MTDPISFSSATARFGLPFLFAGQAQKEFFVNEALARIDALMHPAIISETDDPPASPSDGDCWLVGSNPSGDWIGHQAEIACRQSGNWIYAAPQPGMQVYDLAEGQNVYFDGVWSRSTIIAAPAGGGTQDTEARTAIAELIAVLVGAGILA